MFVWRLLIYVFQLNSSVYLQLAACHLGCGDFSLWAYLNIHFLLFVEIWHIECIQWRFSDDV
jgi:hypothetical protein